MIGKIKGVLVETDGKEGLIETSGGVSYRVQLTPKALAQLVPSALEVYTYLQVREDAQVLFGFDTREQYRMFQTLLTVDGVGPKTAHGVLGHLSVADIINAVQVKSLDAFTAVPGLGKKTAQKIILELCSKLKSDLDIAAIIETPVDNEALEALVTLGYKVGEAKEMLRPIDSTLSTESKIQMALKKKT